jgi:prepilin-type N-terminal cleavage/methylation domain-containing protein
MKLVRGIYSTKCTAKKMKRQQGFTLMEMIITLMIVGILAGVAIPYYQDYSRRAYYTEVVDAVKPYKFAASECIQRLGTLVGCDHATNNIPNAITADTGAVSSLVVANGVITVDPVAQNGILDSDDYVLTPTLQANGYITWASSGEAVTKGYAK